MSNRMTEQQFFAALDKLQLESNILYQRGSAKEMDIVYKNREGDISSYTVRNPVDILVRRSSGGGANVEYSVVKKESNTNHNCEERRRFVTKCGDVAALCVEDFDGTVELPEFVKEHVFEISFV